MSEFDLFPIAGMNTAFKDDTTLYRGGKEPRLYVRDAVNVDITQDGKLFLRSGLARVSSTPFKNLWESPLHREVFGTVGAMWVKVDPTTWDYQELITLGEEDVSHEVLNNLVCVAGPAGIFTFNGSVANCLTLDNPAPPFVISSSGALTQGTYGVAVAWLRGQQESGTSEITFSEVEAGGALDITFPICLDDSVTGTRLYLTRANGGELTWAGDYPVSGSAIHIPLLPAPGRPAQFRALSPMPTGLYLKYWRGRLLTAKGNVLRWSEPMAFHLHDERHGYVQMPQRITFVAPVDGGIWVGQIDHVAFLQGTEPGDLVLAKRASRPPVPGSAISVSAEIVGGNISPDGSPVVAWLAENGYVLGTSSGALIEPQANVMTGIIANHGSSVVLDRRLTTAVI